MSVAGDRCPDRALLDALVDSELDASHALELERHVARCADCAAALDAVEETSRILRRSAARYRAPAALRDRLALSFAAANSLPEPQVVLPAPPLERRRAEPRRWPRSARLVNGVALALAASLAVVLVLPRPDGGAPRAPGDELVAEHVRSLMVSHLTDVSASDQHAVKPWFNGRIDFAPPVVALEDRGFPLVGGRLEYIAGRTAAALVYRRRAHVINLFIWPAAPSSGPAVATRDGFNLVHWSAGGLVFWAVSDLNLEELQAFGSAFRDRAPG